MIWKVVAGGLAAIGMMGVVAAQYDNAYDGTYTPPPSAEGTATAVFAAGCFWCAEKDFEAVPGVLDVVSGYTGGAVENPTYKQVTTGSTGHIEAIEVTYNPVEVTYDDLLYVFWRNVDPIQGNGQFCDIGPQYRSAIFALNDDQRAAAEASKESLDQSGRFDRPIATLIRDAAPFWLAEGYHQDYAKKNPLQYRFYRYSCGRDARLDTRWGNEARGERPTS